MFCFFSHSLLSLSLTLSLSLSLYIYIYIKRERDYAFRGCFSLYALVVGTQNFKEPYTRPAKFIGSEASKYLLLSPKKNRIKKFEQHIYTIYFMDCILWLLIRSVMSMAECLVLIRLWQFGVLILLTFSDLGCRSYTKISMLFFLGNKLRVTRIMASLGKKK